MQAIQDIEDLVLPALLEQLQDEDTLVKKNTTLGQWVKGLREENVAIMQADVKEKAIYLFTEAIALTFAGGSPSQVIYCQV